MKQDKKSEYIQVTKHYGYLYEPLVGYDGKFYVIYRMSNDLHFVKNHRITARRNKKDVIKECEYLEKLNFNEV